MIVPSLKVLAICGLVAVLQIAGCGAPAPRADESTQAAQMTSQCKDPRPQLCTQEYVPVCALLQDGAQRTDASKCVACSDQNVVAYQAGKCT